MSQHRTLIVSGASGQLGRRVLDLLIEKKLANTTIVAATRTPEKVAEFTARGIVARKADFGDKGTLAEAFRGGDRLLLISTDSLVPGVRFAQHKAAIDAAAAAGVKHIVYLSVARVGDNHPVSIVKDHVQTEAALAASKLDYTIVRPTLWTDTLLHSLPYAIASGVLAGATGQGKVAFLTREDTAVVIAAELASDRSGRSITHITGPNAISYGELVKIVSDGVSKTVNYVPISKEDKLKALIAAGLPASLAEIFVQFELATAEGWFSDVAAPHPALHRPPQSVAEWIATNRAALLGNK